MRLSRQDFRLAVRSFARYPGFTITAVLSLALAIALNTTMYSVIDALLNPEIDARAPGRLYSIQTWGDYKHRVDEPARAAMLRELAPLAESMTFTSSTGMDVGVEYANRYAQVRTQTVAPNYFDVMQIGPERGRAFLDADRSAEMTPAIISEQLAATLSPDRDFPLGARIDIDGRAHPVIGIVRHGAPIFLLPTSAPSALPPNFLRLRDGVPPAELQSRVSFLSHRLAMAAREDSTTGFLLKRADSGQFHLANFHYALIAAVMAVLLIACANLANLQLARGIARSRELALRAALGASRRDIIVQLLVESGTLAVGGLLAGLIATFWAMHLIAAHIPQSVAEYVVAPQVSWRLLVFAAVACLFSTVVIGLYPAIRVSRVDPNELLKSGAGTGANRKHRQQYGIMVATEVGLALALVSAAAIVIRTAMVVREVRMSFDPKPLATEAVFMRAQRDTTISELGYARQLLSSVRSIPDVEDAALIDFRGIGQTVTIEQHDGPPLERSAPAGGYQMVTPSYLRTLRLPVIKGRDFLDGTVAEPEAIVDRRFAGRFWPGVDPVGLKLKLGEYKSAAPWIRVVGVIEERVDQSQQVRSQLLSPYLAQAPGEIFVVGLSPDTVRLAKGNIISLSVVARAKSDPARLPVTLRRYVPPSPLLWMVRTATMEESMSIVRMRESHDFVASLFSLFAFLAVALAALGVYGIVDHSVRERKRELGVRLALGATARDIIYVVIRDGNPMVLAGVAVGLYLIKRTVNWLHGFSFEGDEYDALLFASMAACLFATAVIAALIPAWRATKIDPVESLRSE